MITTSYTGEIKLYRTDSYKFDFDETEMSDKLEKVFQKITYMDSDEDELSLAGMSDPKLEYRPGDLLRNGSKELMTTYEGVVSQLRANPMSDDGKVTLFYLVYSKDKDDGVVATIEKEKFQFHNK